MTFSMMRVSSGSYAISHPVSLTKGGVSRRNGCDLQFYGPLPWWLQLFACC